MRVSVWNQTKDPDVHEYYLTDDNGSNNGRVSRSADDGQPWNLAETQGMEPPHSRTADGLSVMAWIRRQRLERARRDLTDADLRTMPVHAIARRWGFSQHSVFTRAFRAAYGISPSDQRPEAGHDAGEDGTVTGRGGGGRNGPRSRPA